MIRKCPNKCIYCSSTSDKNCNEKLSLDILRNIIHDAKKLGTEVICLSGGEPFLHEDICDLAECIWRHDMKCRIYTSGIVLDEDSQPISLLPKVLKKISSFTEKLIFNIEAASEAVYDKIMGTRNCFEKMKQSALSAAKLGMTTEAHFVPMPLNINEINNVLLLCEKLLISRVSFLRLVLHGRALQNRVLLNMNDEELAILKTTLKKLQDTDGKIPVRIGVPLALDRLCDKCEAAYQKLNIRYDGKVFPCEVFKNNFISMYLEGSTPESIYERSLSDIYIESKYLERVRYLSRVFAENCSSETCLGQFLIKGV